MLGMKRRSCGDVEQDMDVGGVGDTVKEERCD